jgi:hypothetical protein
LRSSETTSTDLDRSSAQIARLTSNYVAQKYIRHDSADALLIAAPADHWTLRVFPLSGGSAREMVETHAELH